MFRKICLIFVVLFGSTWVQAQDGSPYFRFDFNGDVIPSELDLTGTRFGCVDCIIDDGSFIIPRRSSLLETAFVIFEPDDFVVNTRVRFFDDAGKVDWASIKVRDPVALDGRSPGYFAGINSLGELRIQGAADVGLLDPNAIASLPDSGLDPFNDDINLQFVVDGPTLSLSA